MTIVPFTPRSDLPAGLWHADEMSQLLSIYAAHEAHGEAGDWDTGETECKEPQFYILGAQPDLDFDGFCDPDPIICIWCLPNDQ
jgi:hypothetical protein